VDILSALFKHNGLQVRSIFIFLKMMERSGRPLFGTRAPFAGLLPFGFVEGRAMNPIFKSVLLLVVSNVFMTFAWYGHLKNLGSKPLFVAILVSWAIAFFEYCFQVPANRAGHTVMTLPQLKIIQEAVTLVVFVPFAMFYMNQPIKLDYLWAGLCMVGAVYFIFRSS
jgi:uncharacterized protein (DUF486 family)